MILKQQHQNIVLSNSSNKGGEIGWIKETLLSKKFKLKIIKKNKKNEISKPIKISKWIFNIKNK